MKRIAIRALPILCASTVCVAPVGARCQAPTTDRAVAVDTARMMADVRVLSADSMEGRAAGSAGNAKARAYLLERFREIGLQPVGDSVERPFTFAGGGAPGGSNVRGVNLVGVIEEIGRAHV